MMELELSAIAVPALVGFVRQAVVASRPCPTRSPAPDWVNTREFLERARKGRARSTFEPVVVPKKAGEDFKPFRDGQEEALGISQRRGQQPRFVRLR
jgi:hypothetical protein